MQNREQLLGMKKMKHACRYIISALILVYGLCGVSVPRVSAAVRIKDIAYFEGVRENQLMGYGLVVGLNGTGDKSQSVFTVKSIASLLSHMGIDVDESKISPKNVAAVMVTATLPPFIKKGARIDITLSSLGDSSSLQGGTLLLTPLQGADKKVYAVAQGQVSVAGSDAAGGGGGAFGTVARIPQGALIEKEVSTRIGADGIVHLSLREIDFTTCVRMAEAINVSFKEPLAHALDGATVAVRVPGLFQKNIVTFLANIEHVEVEPDNRAKIIINERTGTIVGGKDVKISRVSINHKNINMEIKPKEKEVPEKEEREESVTPLSPIAGTGALFSEGDERDTVEVVEEEETTIGEVAQLLHAMGLKPPDMITIFQAIKEAGAIQAELEII